VCLPWSCEEEFIVAYLRLWAVQRSTTVEANDDDGEWKDSEDSTDPSADTFSAPTNDIFFDAL